MESNSSTSPIEPTPSGSLNLLIVIPTYNERDNIPTLIPQIAAALPEAGLLLVDDGSPDGTADLAEQLFQSYPNYRVMRRTGLRGLGRSYVDGFQWALRQGFDAAIEMDADLSHDPKYLPTLAAGASQADLVIGSRYVAGGGVRDWPIQRVILSRYANRYVRMIAGLRVNDATAGYRLYTRRALESISLHTIESNGYSFQVEMTYRVVHAGLNILEVPIIFTDRTAGHSKMSRSVIWESILMPWRLRFGSSGRKARLDASPISAKK